MSTVDRLREDAAFFDGTDERLTREIADAEERLVKLRRHRDQVRFDRAEALAAANVLDNMGFRVERDAAGVVTVSVDPRPEP